MSLFPEFIVSFCLAFMLVLLSLDFNEAALIDTKNVQTWQDAMHLLLVNPRGEPIEQVDEVRRLIQLLDGHQIGHIDPHEIVELDRVDKSKCQEENFARIARAFEICDEYAKPIEMFLLDVLHRQVVACKFDYNFKVKLALLDNELDRNLRQLGELAGEKVTIIEVDVKNARSQPTIFGMNCKTVAEGLWKVMKRYTHIETVTNKDEQQEKTTNFVAKTRYFCSVVRQTLDSDLMNALKDPENLKDKHLTAWLKSKEACKILDRDHFEIRVNIARKWEQAITGPVEGFFKNLGVKRLKDRVNL